jgi:type I restriction enzyme S subunit
LPDEISDLFPDSFEETELGEIPRGWEVQAISEVVDSIFDGPHATPAESDTGHVFLGIKNMSGTRIELDEIRLIHDDDWEAWTRRVEPQPNDIVFTYEAALGLFGLIPPKLKCCLGRRMALIRPLSENGSPHFWFHQFIADPFQRIIAERCIHGATVNRTPLTEFTGYPVLTPPLPLRNHFEGVVSGLWASIHASSEQSRTLVPLRDTLLPKLISGELRIPDAERLLEEAGV